MKHTLRSETEKYLRARYAEQCERFPRTRELGEELYVARNLRAAMANARAREAANV